MGKMIAGTEKRGYRVDAGSQQRTRLQAWLEEEMERRKTNQFALAGKSGVSQGYINGILNRGRIPSDEKVMLLADALGADRDEAIAAVWFDRMDRMLATAPRSIRTVWRRVLREEGN